MHKEILLKILTGCDLRDVQELFAISWAFPGYFEKQNSVGSSKPHFYILSTLWQPNCNMDRSLSQARCVEAVSKPQQWCCFTVHKTPEWVAVCWYMLCFYHSQGLSVLPLGPSVVPWWPSRAQSCTHCTWSSHSPPSSAQSHHTGNSAWHLPGSTCARGARREGEVKSRNVRRSDSGGSAIGPTCV